MENNLLNACFSVLIFPPAAVEDWRFANESFVIFSDRLLTNLKIENFV